MCAILGVLDFGALDVKAQFGRLWNTPEGEKIALVLFVSGLVSYFLGCVSNAVSNTLMRNTFGRSFRLSVLREKLKLGEKDDISAVHQSESAVIKALLPRQRKCGDDSLSEFFAAARTFCSLHASAARVIEYHWSQFRLARAMLLPLALLFAVTAVDCWWSSQSIAAPAIVACLLVATFLTYRYREKFLIYTVIDAFFVAGKPLLARSKGRAEGPQE